MKRDNELQKPSHIVVFDQEKGKATCIKMYGAQKAKSLFSKMKYQKFRHRSQNEMYCSKMIKCYVL